ncbi:MAG: ClpXP protease specificity-enhancing factor [Candidatus Sedimenticola endophacoides]|uniref:ClpXP protease specificity-enhancing factor n=1 Tax=Candidatus Sedimenticola endophacoides TaxID=2548426 RepID=A0A657PPE0_9GAMM|nr:MAG: ClpXP protease specificity-enhancing factor [Candidatus Sedimenticola endophacoides]OQX35334.1 MAG: ClpXP protease specificity-enhancing factor [Candidatus Sedimenticola endophacoides]OQX38388.1 MAG: ClpXP protease specificity-enhancing factor [Candidatus Sedimenticola endophacoides]OQX38819.1 MAG: ClpXP protease specificity-enhancing factor [Candidatus Sedimenticola endophacoides]OQX44151.1 MAG: ClpXP protease specificity-enhancing factor [Candidatus Sedimenticola endophacoides]
MAALSSNRPYLIRALYEWLLDNDLTPHLLVDVEHAGVRVPEGFAEEGRMVLNISPSAVRGLELGNDLIHFNARFGGSPMDIFVPPGAVLGIYARENGHGMLFPDDIPEDSDEGPDGDPDPQPPRERPSLKVVK